jgi:hypothetical protein
MARPVATPNNDIHMATPSSFAPKRPRTRAEQRPNPVLVPADGRCNRGDLVFFHAARGFEGSRIEELRSARRTRRSSSRNADINAARPLLQPETGLGRNIGKVRVGKRERRSLDIFPQAGRQRRQPQRRRSGLQQGMALAVVQAAKQLVVHRPSMSDWERGRAACGSGR